MTTPPIDAVAALGFLPPSQPLPAEANAQTAPAGSGFVRWFAAETALANQRVLEAERGVQRLAAGDTANLHDVMIGIEQARLQFQLLTQVRNRLVEAYQDVLRMQI